MCLARLVKVGRLSLHCCHFTIWICNAPISRWPWSIIPRLSCVILRAIWIYWPSLGTKLAKIVIIQVLGSIENEHTFSTFNFMNNQLRNQLNMQLDLCIWFYSHQFLTFYNFPYDQAIAKWQGKTHYYVNT
jgi:hypothetical protein